MCTIIWNNRFVGKNYDSAAACGMLFTNKKGLIKEAAVFTPGRPLGWTAAFGSITFSQSGKEIPVSGINEAGLAVEQATMSSAVYPESCGKPMASSLEITQFLLDTCGSVSQALWALEQIAPDSSSWPVHYMLADSGGDRAVVEYHNGEKKIYSDLNDRCGMLTNIEYSRRELPLNDFWLTEREESWNSADEMFSRLEQLQRSDTIWSNVYDLQERKLYVRRRTESETTIIRLEEFDFTPAGKEQMMDIIKGDSTFRPFDNEENRRLIAEFYHNPAISRIMKLPDPEGLIEFIAGRPKSYDRTNEIVLRFLEGEQIRQLPMKAAHKYCVLQYLASKFETGKEYTEGQVNALIDEWHTFGDYFVLRRELIDSGLMKRLPNGSKYWREIG
jgi:Penicillin V acylase and related amidases